LPILRRNQTAQDYSRLQGSYQDHTGANVKTTLAESSRSWENYVEFNPYENPGWKRAIARGEFVFSQLHGETVERKLGSPATLSATRQGEDIAFGIPATFNNCQISGDAGAEISIPPPIEVDPTGLAFNQASERFIRKALAARQQVAGGVALGELGETLRMLRSPYRAVFDTFTRHLSTVKKRASRRGIGKKQQKKVISDTWLETQFGLLPLLSDIDGIAQGLASITTYRLDRKIVVGEGESSRSQLFNEENRQYDGIKWGLRYQQFFKSSCRLRGCVKISVDPLTSKLEAFGLMPSDFVPTIYELIPFSFLVDYFSNTGAVIQALSFPTAALQWVTIEWRHLASGGFLISTPPYFDDAPWKDKNLRGSLGSPSVVRRIAVSREIYPGAPVPSLRVKIPGVDSLKWLNVAALIASSRRVSASLAFR
jgi:hypothetical protein